jgi:hypothetical protein
MNVAMLARGGVRRSPLLLPRIAQWRCRGGTPYSPSYLFYSTEAKQQEQNNEELPPRDSDKFEMVIVGAGRKDYTRKENYHTHGPHPDLTLVIQHF